MTLRVQRDDGAIAYLNGVEVFRSNMPTGAVNHLTLASSGATGADETVFHSTSVSPWLLRAGTNVLAVEVHQSTNNSSDLAFDLELVPLKSFEAAFLPAGSAWRYLDTGANLGTAWRGTNYNDSGWASGPAELGFGDGDEATVISNRAQITFYFRQTFTVANPAIFTNLLVRLVRDDGAVVYLNSNEVFRSNMPAGTILFSTRALTAVGNADESAWFTNALNPALLVAGPNTLAVEVHQVTNTSSDVSFNLELTARATGTPLTPPPLAIQFTMSNATLTWPQSPTPFRLESSATLAPADWQPWPGPLATNVGFITAPAPPTNFTRFFRLRWP